ncbi:extracellular ribonuclease LE-like [Humulus lupulus]|uniref:extracellular ribonuclease LE-like n=1 Tax=Humulus lupulus TaxID=3486 RepID=UPI002B415653|nr:extracellular ribonuclease LE-like [Humulus lupulus]
MKSALITILLLSYLSVLCVADNFDFFFFVQQWPGSYCEEHGCCKPSTGVTPSEKFTIIGLWPKFSNGSTPSSCNPSNAFDQTKISDLISSMEEEWTSLSCPSNDGTELWGIQWSKHGTCSESVLDQHAYFQANLNLKNSVDLLQALKTAGIVADGSFYEVEKIKEAIKSAVGYTPGLSCHNNSAGESMLYQVYLCVDSSGSNFIECPVFPKGKACVSQALFPTFEDITTTLSHVYSQ